LFPLCWHLTHVAFYMFCIYICFVKALTWWGVTRSTQPHVHTYMFCPYVISTLYWFLEESQLWTSKRYVSHALFSQLYTLEKWIKIPLLFITTVFHRALASCCSRKTE
jgi:hypothetical protein